jgi:hypothetical protein
MPFQKIEITPKMGWDPCANIFFGTDSQLIVSWHILGFNVGIKHPTHEKRNRPYNSSDSRNS